MKYFNFILIARLYIIVLLFLVSSNIIAQENTKSSSKTKLDNKNNRFVGQPQHQDIQKLSTEEKYKLLEDSHKRFQFLPFEKEYIFNHIFKKIQQERIYVAPNYPQRGFNAEETEFNIYYWLENYSEEFKEYLDFLNGIYNYYEIEHDKNNTNRYE
jgi:uncharacterized FlgJ-related protein